MMRTLLLLTALAACGKDYPQCEKFVDFAVKCDDDFQTAAPDERKTARVLMGGMCEEAFRNDTSRAEGKTRQLLTEVYAETRKRADCAAKAGSCDQYEACTE